MLNVGLALGAALVPCIAHAAGYIEAERGVAAFARGGADIAVPEDPIAINLNPAALAQSRGLSLMLDGNFVWDARSFSRAQQELPTDRAPRAYESVHNSWRPSSPSPGIFGSYNLASLGVPDLTVGLALYGPTRVYREWPVEGPQRYSEVRYAPVEVHSALALAYSLPWYGLKVGVTGRWTQMTVDSRLRLHVNSVSTLSEDGRYDIDVNVLVRDRFIPGAILGISAEPSPWVVLAVAYQLPYDIRATGDADIAMGKGLRGITVEGNRIDLDLDMPAVLRAAVRLQEPRKQFDIEVAFVWEGWSRSKNIVFKPQEIIVDTGITQDPLQDIVIETRWRDTYSVRLGGSVVVLPELLRLRAGGYYERAAIAPDRLNVATFDLDKVGVTAGARIDMPMGLWMDFAVGYVYWLERDVNSTTVRLTDPLVPSAPLWETANGRYQNNQTYVMAALGAQLDL